MSRSQFLGAPTHADIIEFENFLLQLKTQTFGSKTVCGSPIILILKGVMTFQSQRVHAFFNINFNKNEAKSKMENPTHIFRETNLELI